LKVLMGNLGSKRTYELITMRSRRKICDDKARLDFHLYTIAYLFLPLYNTIIHAPTFPAL
jgi:hypothetical protein